jgi:hypothetical protein
MKNSNHQNNLYQIHIQQNQQRSRSPGPYPPYKDARRDSRDYPRDYPPPPRDYPPPPRDDYYRDYPPPPPRDFYPPRDRDYRDFRDYRDYYRDDYYGRRRSRSRSRDGRRGLVSMKAVYCMFYWFQLPSLVCLLVQACFKF